MSKLFIHNLGLIITEACNLKCHHCMRGQRTSKNMSKEVINELGQIDLVGNLTICGGEPTLAISTLEEIINYIIENKINLSSFTITINGTNYSEELLRLLDHLDDYIPKSSYRTNALLGISLDQYHYQEVKRLGIKEQYIENLKRYQENDHFFGYREIDNKLFREGRATSLKDALTVPLRPWPIIYADNRHKDIMLAGPLVTINTDGIVTECDASIPNQRTKYNYGNILEEDIRDIIIRNGKKVSLLSWPYQTGKIMQKQMKYSD